MKNTSKVSNWEANIKAEEAYFRDHPEEVELAFGWCDGPTDDEIEADPFVVEDWQFS